MQTFRGPVDSNDTDSSDESLDNDFDEGLVPVFFPPEFLGHGIVLDSDELSDNNGGEEDSEEEGDDEVGIEEDEEVENEQVVTEREDIENEQVENENEHVENEHVENERVEVENEHVENEEVVPVAEAAEGGGGVSEEQDPDRVEAATTSPEPELNGTHQNKRKHSDESDSSDSSSKRLATDDTESYSNPMVEDDSSSDNQLRGDRIGTTTYSERLVLRILMRWVQDLPKYTINQDASLPRSLDRDLSLLWDMSLESDVAEYLVGKDVYGIVGETLRGSTCHRLTEITLGLLANLLSSPELLPSFPPVDSQLGLVQQIVNMTMYSTDVPVLIECFAVIRRLVWFLGNVEVVKDWMDLLTGPAFVQNLGFLLRSSTSVPLLSDMISSLFTVLEVVVDQESLSEPFRAPTFLPSLLEALTELLKGPDKDQAIMKDLIEDVSVPEQVQTALCLGLGALCYLQKIGGTQGFLAQSLLTTTFLTSFYSHFGSLTSSLSPSKALEYFRSGLSLLGTVHVKEWKAEAVQKPVKAAEAFGDLLNLPLEDYLEVMREVWGAERVRDLI